MANYCNHYCHEFLQAKVVELNHLQKLLSLLSLSQKKIANISNKYYKSTDKNPYEKKNIFHFNIPIEFRLLLSSDKDCESTPVCDPLMLGLTILVGLDKRFSRSTSERSGLFGVN